MNGYVWNKLRTEWQEHAPWLQVVFATLPGVLAAIVPREWRLIKTLLLIIFGGLAIAAGYGAWRRTGSIRDLTQRIAALQAEVQAHEHTLEQVHQVVWDLWTDVLEFLVRTIEFTPRDRVSLYKHHDNHFIPLGRYSSNPGYAAKGRPFYPDDQGCIGRAWLEGEFVIPELPDFDAQPDEYIAAQRAFGVDEETVRGLTMKSRTYGAFVIEDSGRKRNIAIVVFESTDARRFDYNVIREVVQNSAQLVANLIGVLNDLGVTPIITTTAEEEPR